LGFDLADRERVSSAGSAMESHNVQSFHTSCTEVDPEESENEAADGDDDEEETKAMVGDGAGPGLVARQAARIDELASDLARERARSSRLEVRNAELDADVSILAKKLTVQQKREMNLMNAMRRMQSEHACPATPPTPRRLSSSDRCGGVFGLPLARKLSLPGSGSGERGRAAGSSGPSAADCRRAGSGSVMSGMTGTTDYWSEGSTADMYELESESPMGGAARQFRFR